MVHCLEYVHTVHGTLPTMSFLFLATLELSVGDNYTESQSYLDLWTCYCDYLRRRTESLGDHYIYVHVILVLWLVPDAV